MFTGIIQSKSLSAKLVKKSFGAELIVSVESGFTKKLKKGDSVAVNGVCLTVCSFSKKTIKFEIIHESLRLSNLVKNISMPLNLERSLKMGEEKWRCLNAGYSPFYSMQEQNFKKKEIEKKF